MRFWLRVAALVVTCVLQAPSAFAQACCAATGSTELGVLGPKQGGVLAAQLGHDHGFGSIDAAGDYRRLEHAEVDDLVLTLAGGVRVLGPLQLNGALPLRLQRRELGGLEPATRVGFGDASLSARLTLSEDRVTGIDFSQPESLVPFLEPFAGVRAPTGRGPNDSDEPTQADVMGDGVWMAFAGLSVTKFLAREHALLLSGSWGHRFSRQVDSTLGGTREFSPGDEVDGRLGYMYVPNVHWSMSAFSTLRLTARVRYDGDSVPDSDSRRIRFGASVSHHPLYPSWQLTLSASVDPPVPGFGKNVPFAGTSLAFAVQRNFGR